MSSKITKKSFYDLLDKVIGAPPKPRKLKKAKSAGYTGKRTHRRTSAGTSPKRGRVSRG